jgi:hypothetical protein
MEVWKDIPDYEGKYQVSSLGNVKSLNYHREHKEKLLTLCEDSYGYLTVLLYKDGKRKACAVHRLVASAFLDNTTSYPSINHKDENKHNNCVDNLEYCSVGYNNRYSKEIPVLQCDRDGNVIKRWNSIKEAGEETNIKPTNIGACCRGYGRVKTAGGYVWRYVV